VKWFALAHEMGHFFLHPFLRDNMFNSKEIEKSKKKILGRFEMEADHFANMVFLPDRIMNDHFENNVREALTKNNACDLQDLFVEIFKFCLEFTKQKLDIRVNSLPKRAILNLKFRSNRYVCRLREQLLISNYNYADAFDLSLVNKNPFPKEDPFEQYLLNNGS